HGSARTAAGRVCVGHRLAWGEGGGVHPAPQPVLRPPRSARTDPRYPIRSFLPAVGKPTGNVVVALPNTGWKPTLDLKDRCNVPAPKNLLSNAGAGQTLSSSERQIPNRRNDCTVGQVKDGIAVVTRKVIVIQRPWGSVDEGVGLTVVVIEHFRPGVACSKRKADAVHAPFYLGC